MDHNCSGAARRPSLAPIARTLLVILGLVAPLLAGLGTAAAQTIKIGAVLTLTGDVAAYGIAQMDALILARDMINEAGGVLGQPIELIIEDSRGDKNGAINAVSKLTSRDRVLAIVGPTLSAEMFAVGPVANRSRVTIMGISNTAVGIDEIGPWVFRNSLPEELVLPETVRRSHERLGYATAALLYANNDDFSKSGADTFREALAAHGVRIVATEAFQTGDTDFRAQLTKVASANPDVLVISSLYKEAALLLRQARQLGLTQPVIGGNGFNAPEFIEIAGEAGDGAIVGSPWFAGRDHPKVREFVAAYRARYGTEPNQFAAQAFDALYLFAEAIRIAQSTTNRQAFRDALASIKNFDGVTGIFTFDENGRPRMDANVLQVKDGAYVEF